MPLQELDRQRKRVRLFEAIASSTPDFLYAFDLQGRFLFANQRLLDVWGTTADQAIGKNLYELGYPEWHADMHMRELRQVIETLEPIKGEVPFTGGSGISGVYEYIFTPVIGPDGLLEMIAGTTREVTDRKRAEQEREAKEALLQQLSDAMPQIVWAARPDGTLDYYNRRWFEFINLTDNSENAAWDRYVHPDDLPRVAETWRRSLQNGERYQIEFRVRGGDGVYCWFLVRAEPVKDATGRILRWYGTCTDIESQKQVEVRNQFLLALDEATRPLSDPNEITAVHAEMLGRHLNVDRCAYADVEADQDTFNLTGNWTGPGVSSIIGRYRFAQFGQECLARMRADEPFVVEDIDRHQPPLEDLSSYRSTTIQSVICVPLHKGGQFTAAMAVHQVFSRRWTSAEIDLLRHVAARCWESIERTRVERTLRESEARFRTMANSAPVMVWLRDVHKDCTWLNKAWVEFTGRPMAQDLGSGWMDNIHPDDLEQSRDTFTQAFDRREPFQMDYRLRRADGEWRWIQDHGVPLSETSGLFEGYIGSCIDITDRKLADERRHRLLEAERAARSEAEHASRMKDEFLATLSHELRTPLNAILGWAQILRVNPSASDVSEGIQIIDRNARAQTQIIEDLLDMSRIISGKVRLDVRPVDLAGVVTAAIETVQPGANAKQVRLQSVFDPSVGEVAGDPNRLQQVFWNLLSNAVKFTPRGGRVQVVIERVQSQLEVSITDTGEGIAPEFLPHVFDRFRQADASTTRKHGGLGLGLAIVKQLTELHGGSVAVRSGGRGQGATFIVSLPLTSIRSSYESEDNASGQPLRSKFESAMGTCMLVDGIKVLVVDDEPDSRSLVKRLLENCNATVIVASSADEARKRLSEDNPHLLISDIGMPGEDGLSLIRSIRKRPAAAGGQIPAIALTAYARTDDRVKALLAGFDQHLVKPVEPVELITIVAVLAGRVSV